MKAHGVPTSLHAITAWIPLFQLRCEEERNPDVALKPTALVTDNDSHRLWQVSPRARHFGVRSGMTISQAIGLCPALTLFEPDPVYYDDVYSRLLLTLEDFSPVIEPSELGRVYIGVDGLERLVGGPDRQLETITEILQRYPVAGSLRLGWGRGKFMAWIAAMRSHPGEPVVVTDDNHAEFLSQQSVACLPIHPDTHRRLLQLGIRTLGDLSRLPEPAVVSQFGREGREARQYATGAVCQRVVGRVRPQQITAGIDFTVPVADLQLLGNAMARLFDRTIRDPRRIGWRVRSVRVAAKLENGGSWRLVTPLKSPAADRDNIMDVVRVRVAGAPPQGGVTTLEVALVDFAPGTDELQLFARDESGAARAGQRKALRWAAGEIKTRLKRSLLYHVVEVNPWSRIPERRYALIDYDP